MTGHEKITRFLSGASVDLTDFKYYIPEFGKRGQVKKVDARVGRQELLLPGFGVYASPYNLAKYKDIVLPEDAVTYTSPTVASV